MDIFLLKEFKDTKATGKTKCFFDSKSANDFIKKHNETIWRGFAMEGTPKTIADTQGDCFPMTYDVFQHMLSTPLKDYSLQLFLTQNSELISNTDFLQEIINIDKNIELNICSDLTKEFPNILAAEYSNNINNPENLKEEYRAKIVTFDSHTKIKQITLREILWNDFQQKGKPKIYESNIIEIFGGNFYQIKKAFINNGLSIQNTDLCSIEDVIEIGIDCIFNNENFYSLDELLEKLEYDSTINMRTILPMGILFIQINKELAFKYSRVYKKLTSLVEDCYILVFINDSSFPTIIPFLDLENKNDLSLEYILQLYRGWEKPVAFLEQFYECLRFNIMI